ncbi:MAG: winged helix-turn-helix domain-containing protein [Armatimonas sp.]
MLTPWQVRLLGDFRAERGHQVVTRFRSRATMALFAYLCLHPGRLFSREELADRFWPEADVEAGRASLRVALNSLKKALEPPPDAPNSVIEATREAIRLRPEAVIVDVREFEKAVKERRIEDALALYGGDFLPGFYDEWVLDEQGRLQGLIPNQLLPLTPSPKGKGERTELASSGIPATDPIGDSNSPFPLGEGVRGRGNNLPLTLDAFFGREAELAQAQGLLQTNRLVCLMGPGGMGKTRTALEVARGVSGFPGGVWFVPLAAVLDSRRIPGAISEAMGLPQGSEPLAGVTERTLVVLDNLEQLDSSVGAEVERLLARMPALVVLATSRARLGVRGERVITLGALSLPEVGEPLGKLAQRPAVALFCDRARGASAEFGLTERNAGAITGLCQKLEGLPLAIELAAAWAGVLTPGADAREVRAAPGIRGQKAR